MKEIIKDLLKSTVISIGMAMTIFCIIGILFDVRYSGNFRMENYQYTKMVIGCVIVGLGFGIPSVIYQKDSLPMPIRVLIHMGTGCVVYTIVAYAVGWIGNTETIGQRILSVLIQFATAFFIWFLFLRYYRKEAKSINEKLQARNDK